MSENSNPFARQSRAARELLGWTQTDLSKATGLSISAIKNYERCLTNSIGTSAALRQTFEKHNIQFEDETRDGFRRLGVAIIEAE